MVSLNKDYDYDLVTNKLVLVIQVLNEVVVDRGPCPYLTNIDLYLEHRYVTSVQGDGEYFIIIER